ncbi:MAG: pyridoxal phosphate-dependent aminotransferase [Candidatus Heimdallarchaeota archaeon]|nr:MAG: pyridoxal phosphate-dependent aminotransferase [Candidatus Heimdallarchaeota archaeon]
MGIFLELEKIAQTHPNYLHLSNCDPPVYGYVLEESVQRKIDQLQISKFSGYPSWNGDEKLRQALSQRIQEICNVELPPNKIVMTYGVSEGFPLTFDALFNKTPGSVAIPDPSYIPLIVQARRFSNIWFYTCDEELNWNPDMDQLVTSLEKHSDTKAIVIITPNSPTGAVYSEKILKELINIAGQYNLIIITDEIYDSMTFGTFVSPLEFAQEIPVIYLNGFSKVYRLPGYRLGYLGWYDPLEKHPDIWQHLKHLCKGRLGVTSIAQEIAKLALQEPKEATLDFVESVHKKQVFLTEHLESIDGISVVPAQGGTYVFPRITYNIDDEMLTKYLLKTHRIYVTPGSAYGLAPSKNHLRFVTLASQEALLKGVHALKKSLEVLGK